MTKIEYKCSQCGNIVLRYSRRIEERDIKNVFCNRKCRGLYYRSPRIECSCDNCGKKLPDRTPSQIRGYTFCSSECKQAFHILDPVWREKQRLGSIERSKDPIWIENNKNAMNNTNWLRKNKKESQKEGVNNIVSQKRIMSSVWLRKNKKANRKKANDPEWLRKNKEANQRKSQDPEWKRKQKEGAQKSSKSLVWKHNHKIGCLKRSQNLEWKCKNKESNQRKAQDPEWMRKVNAAVQIRSKDPEYQRKIREASQKRIGISLSEEVCISMSMSRQGITNRSDWIGYLTETLYCKLFTPEFKLRQYEISDYTCILCDTKVEKPHCHHVYEQKASCCQTIDDQGDLFFMIRNQKFYPYILPMVDKEKELEYGLNKFAVLCNKCHGKVKGKKNGKSVFDYIHEIEQIINTKYKGRSYYIREEYWGNGYYYYQKGEREIYCDAVTGEIYGKYLRGFQEYGLPKK